MSGRREGAKRPHGMTGKEKIRGQLHEMTRTLQTRRRRKIEKTRKEGDEKGVGERGGDLYSMRHFWKR